MEEEIGAWIVESVARDTTISDQTLNSLINTLPIPTHNFSLNKSLLLRRILSELQHTNLPYENVLDLLEMAEELDHAARLLSTHFIKRAYREVALEYTIKAMDDGAEYFEVVKRVWRGRVLKMGDCGLVSGKLMEWVDDVEAAVWDQNARQKLKKNRTQIDAVAAVKAYLAQAWDQLGPPFLDVVAELVENDETVKQALGLGERVQQCRASELHNDDVVAEMNNDTTREVSGLGNIQMLHQQLIINDANNAEMNNDTTRVVSGLGDNQILHQHLINDANKAELNHDSTSDVLGLGDNQVLHQHLIINDANNEVNDDTTRDVSGLGDNQVLHQHLIINDANNLSQSGTRMPRRKHVAKKRPRGSIAGTSRGAKISDTEQVDNEELSKNYGCLPLPAIDKVQEALKASSSELHAVVTDPLPEALELAENGMYLEGPLAKKDKAKRNPEVLENDSDPKGPCISNENNVLWPSLMIRNTSARTYEWNDSIDDLPEGDTSAGSRIKLPSPKNRAVSPLKKHEMKDLTRRRKVKWSTLEEETLRAGVEKYGQGCWKAILTAYPDVFEGRTDVNLKDKWRNMTRYSH